MVKLTVIYDLPPGADHAEFLKWRTTEHQKDNMSQPGVIKSDFYTVKQVWRNENLPYRYITEAYYPDMETFEKSFFDADYQHELAESLKRIGEPLFLISEEVLSEVNQPGK